LFPQRPSGQTPRNLVVAAVLLIAKIAGIAKIGNLKINFSSTKLPAHQPFNRHFWQSWQLLISR
jgi:hypothetical protein